MFPVFFIRFVMRRCNLRAKPLHRDGASVSRPPRWWGPTSHVSDVSRPERPQCRDWLAEESCARSPRRDVGDLADTPEQGCRCCCDNGGDGRAWPQVGEHASSASRLDRGRLPSIPGTATCADHHGRDLARPSSLCLRVPRPRLAAMARCTANFDYRLRVRPASCSANTGPSSGGYAPPQKPCTVPSRPHRRGTNLGGHLHGG